VPRSAWAAGVLLGAHADWLLGCRPRAHNQRRRTLTHAHDPRHRASTHHTTTPPHHRQHTANTLPTHHTTPHHAATTPRCHHTTPPHHAAANRHGLPIIDYQADTLPLTGAHLGTTRSFKSAIDCLHYCRPGLPEVRGWRCVCVHHSGCVWQSARARACVCVCVWCVRGRDVCCVALQLGA
jgi:hypothetical protein